MYLTYTCGLQISNKRFFYSYKNLLAPINKNRFIQNYTFYSIHSIRLSRNTRITSILNKEK